MKKYISPKGYHIGLAAIFCALAFLLLTAAKTHAAPESACGDYHTIQKGETMYGISKQYDVPIPALMRANPQIKNPNWIYAGTYLYIPCSPGDMGTGGECQVMHRVALGQTLTEIARHYMVNPWHIAEVNGIYNLDLIFAGQILCIP